MQNRLELIGDKIRLSVLFPDEILQYSNFEMGLANKLNAVYGIKKLPEDTRQGLKERLIPRLEKAGDNWILHTIWLIISLEYNLICGAIGFKGEINELGAIETGAAMYDGFMNRGYMTEATTLLCNWGLSNDSITSIIACTNIDNHSSQRVLIKSGFEITKVESESIWFQKNRNN
jgi:[ribosomal protein S5]-alanine N-acetyltransferase